MFRIGRSLPCVALTLAVFTALPSIANAQTPSSPATSLFTCRTADGRVISSDRPVTACADREVRELNRDGSVKRVIAAPLTPAQRREARDREVQRQQDELAQRLQRARDRNLLLTFEDEAALESMRARSMADIDEEIHAARLRILSYDKELKSAQADAEAWLSQNRTQSLPFSRQQRITEAANAILAENALIEERKAERSRIEARFESDRTRLRELLGHQADRSGNRATN